MDLPKDTNGKGADPHRPLGSLPGNMGWGMTATDFPFLQNIRTRPQGWLRMEKSSQTFYCPVTCHPHHSTQWLPKSPATSLPGCANHLNHGGQQANPAAKGGMPASSPRSRTTLRRQRVHRIKGIQNKLLVVVLSW